MGAGSVDALHGLRGGGGVVIGGLWTYRLGCLEGGVMVCKDDRGVLVDGCQGRGSMKMSRLECAVGGLCSICIIKGIGLL